MDQAVLETKPPKQTNAFGANNRGANEYRLNGRPHSEPALQSRVRDALKQSGYNQLRNLGVTVHGGEVVLCGRLPTYYLTQLALTKAMRVDGVARVRNEIQVNSPFN